MGASFKRTVRFLCVVIEIHKPVCFRINVIPGQHIVHVFEHFYGRLCLVLYGLQNLRTMEIPEVLAHQVSLDEPAQKIGDRHARAVVNRIRFAVLHGTDPLAEGIILLAVFGIIHGPPQAEILKSGIFPGPFRLVRTKNRELHSRHRALLSL